MTKLLAGAAVAGALLCVVTASAASGRAATRAATPPINWGIADDSSKYADDGGSWFYQQMAGANLTEDRWTVAWNPSNPTAITELPFIQRAAPVAQAKGVHIVLALYAGQNGTSTPDATDHDATAFCAWAKSVAAKVKQWGISDFIVWNEPSSTLYWAPQKDASGNDVAAPAYEALLADCYDQLHSLDGGGWTANVIGMGLSAKASRNTSNQPLAFLRDVGTAYKASGRTAPIMDQLALHPYPLPSKTPSPDKGYAGTPDAYGPPDLARVKQAVYDAFNGTGQKTTLNGLTFRLDEFGWQTTETGSQYTGVENAGPPGSAAAVSEQTQAQYLAQAVGMFACDPTVSDVGLFQLVDEANLAGWQSGLMTAGGQGVSTKKVAYDATAPLFAQGRSACTTGTLTWTPGAAGSAGSTTAGSSGSAGSTGSSGGTGGTTGGTSSATDLSGLSVLVQDPAAVTQQIQQGIASVKPESDTTSASPSTLANKGGDVVSSVVGGEVTSGAGGAGGACRTGAGVASRTGAGGAPPGPGAGAGGAPGAAAGGITGGMVAVAVAVVAVVVAASSDNNQVLADITTNCTPRILSAQAKAPVIVAAGTTRLVPGKPFKVKLKLLLKGKHARVGKYFAVFIMASAADRSKRVGFAVQFATVKAAKKTLKAKKSGSCTKKTKLAKGYVCTKGKVAKKGKVTKKKG